MKLTGQRSQAIKATVPWMHAGENILNLFQCCRYYGLHTSNPFDSKGNYSATSNNTKLAHWPLMGGWYSEEGPWRAAAPPSPLLAVPNVTAHPSTASVPITVLLLHDGQLLRGFNDTNVTIKGLIVMNRVHISTECR